MTEFLCLFWDSTDDFFNVRFVLVLLKNDELITSALGDFEESITSHLHNAWELLLHELEQLFDDGF